MCAGKGNDGGRGVGVRGSRPGKNLLEVALAISRSILSSLNSLVFFAATVP